MKNSVTMKMLADKLVVIISDNAMFLVSTEENSKRYDEEFYPVTKEGREAYNIEFNLKRNMLIA